MSSWSVGSDHAGFELKQRLLDMLERSGTIVIDRGCHGPESVDYPDYAALVANDIAEGRADRGLLVCGTGIGMSLAANKVRGVRAALCHSVETGTMARAHNDANILCIGSRVVDAQTAEAVLVAFMETPFEGGRHQRRVAKINAIEVEGEA